MMRQYELVERVLSYDPKADEALLNRAYVYAMRAHGTQKRADGAPFFSHPLEVAAILTEFKLDDATIATALLHDVIEDTDTPRSEIDQLFGGEIGALVDGLTKIKKLDLVTKEAQQAENFRKLLVAISSDIRVLLVKLADRLHNMRTLEHKKPASRRRTSEETIDIYAPLAGLMGIQAMRDELEDHAFRWLYPEAYDAVSGKLAELRNKNVNLVEDIRLSLSRKLAEMGVEAEVRGREKRPYAIWRKMQNKQISLEQLSDIYGFRIIVGTTDECYRVLGVVHSTWQMVPGRFKDYISVPKRNNYRSLHTTLIGPRAQRVELQIRTREMHEVAEYGIAAHALYKNGMMLGSAVADVARGVVTDKGEISAQMIVNAQANGAHVVHAHAPEIEENPYFRLRQLVGTLLEGSNSEEFLEHTKLELFHDQVFCFTPKGRLIALPHGATALDFAYAVHTDIGNTSVSAYINGRRSPIDTILRNGDEVQILTSKTHRPPLVWEKFVVTGRARGAIRKIAREAARQQYSELGRRLLASKFEAADVAFSDEKVRRVMARLNQKSIEDLYAAVARNELAPSLVVKAVAPDAQLPEPVAPARRPRNRYDTVQNQEGWFNLSKVMGLKFKLGNIATGEQAANSGGAPSRIMRSDMPVVFEEGGAVPGDRIVGILTPSDGIHIFQIHSPSLQQHEHDNWIDVTWDLDPEQPVRFPAHISVTALNEPGSLAEIAQVIGEADGNIDNVKMMHRGADFTEMKIDLEVWDLPHLNHIIAGLRQKAVVNTVERVFE
ncbi:MAG TPA: bifunctional (p)ppGpp synthetase/guanosine-3',5'-bis(diphosphate) 3'-pyrophosphohydrolase [Hyphomicrobiaceae bacterium]|nr:bifunctional (p)ppGpp synthetase/guanosine-3',5'-bis(diphosphate) 3'-pyrophosphohydrolase [Hyphomicrobiaceae bacterium]